MNREICFGSWPGQNKQISTLNITRKEKYKE